MFHQTLLKALFTMLIIGLFSIFFACKEKAENEQYTPEFISKGSGIILDNYKIIEKYDDKDYQEDGWGQQVWLVKQSHPIKKEILDSLVTNDSRWEFQNDARQQYFFHENKKYKYKTIYISTDDSIMSLCYEWKKY